VIIDAHCHAGELGQHYPSDFAKSMMQSINLPPEAITTHVHNLLATMDANGIDRAFLLAFDAERTLGVKVPNAYVAEICHDYPQRFVGFCSVDAGVPSAADEVQRCVRELGMRGLKIAPAYVRLAPHDRAWYPVYETAAALNIPILMHTGWTPAKGATLNHGRPSLHQVASDFPTLALIMAHMSMPWIDQCLDLLVAHPNLYADLSLFGWYQPSEVVAQNLAQAVERRVVERIIWGTDYPWGPIGVFRERMQLLMANPALFPARRVPQPSQWDQIMGATALRLVS